ncbi:hypothetical protein HUJ05_010750 [Dendroctonus ponderosae]|nr:hypothetical protein HUJ05_010750 [Dendroctonus ponderosae]
MSLKKEGKITLGMLKGKPVTTSVPSISIKFHANVEQIEELRFSDDETPISEEKNSQFGNLPAVTSSNDQDSSPLKLFPKLVKRSTSVDVSTNQTLSSSPPSDPWRFFSDIKGKITKSVEEKITEIKARHEEGSPLHKSKVDQPKVKENLSFSDSEDQSESSISRTCGFASTTEGVEMSSDDETSSVDKEKKPHSSDTLRQKFRFFKHHSDKNTSKEGTVNINSLSKIYNINTENVEQALPEDVSEDVESAVDALEETDFKRSSPEKNDKRLESENIIKKVAQKFVNIDVDKDNVINITQVSGDEVRKRFFAEDTKMSTVFAPTGFIDVRIPKRRPSTDANILNYVLLSVYIVAYAILHAYLPYLAGFLLGASLTLILAIIYMKLYSRPLNIEAIDDSVLNRIMEVPAVKEYQPLTKYEGWVNEYPEAYDPLCYHISHTQSVFLRLQGNLLRISHSKSKVPKRAMWNEHEIKTSFVHHRVYNLLNAKITLLPEGLAKIRLWSKKYPICIMLSKEQMNFDPTTVKMDFEDEAEEKPAEKVKSPKTKKKFTFKKREYPYMSQRFSKLAEDQDIDLDSDSRASTPSPEIAETTLDNSLLLQEPEEKPDDDEMYSCPDDSSECSQNASNSLMFTHTDIYIFGRTDREKEDWFRRLAAATHQDGGNIREAAGYGDADSVKTEMEYLKYMSIFNKGSRKSSKQGKGDKDCEVTEKSSIEDPDESKSDVQLWFNALIGRVLFDCVRDASFTKKVQNRIQKKLQTIKLPYFIEEILITELNLGKTPPLILKSENPILDNRGLWVDLDMSYEGSVVLTLQTKLNLMKLKNPQANDKLGLEIKLAIYHSDVDDSAESSTDEEGLQELPVNREGTGERALVYEKKKKFIKMVDRIAESKIFQAAAENRYIKKAMEGVSNTELRLTVELKALSGTLVLNIPPPPNDRVWVGFRPAPKLILTACPIVGERNFNNTMVTSWIEKKIVQEFEKVMVIPNMEDFLVPVMTPKLPE